MHHQVLYGQRHGSGRWSPPLGPGQGDGPVVLWLNARREVLGVPAPRLGLLALLAAHGLPYTLRYRPWSDPTLRGEPLLVAVADLGEPLEIVVNGTLAACGVVHLTVMAGDEVVIGQPWYLRQRFPFYLPDNAVPPAR
ncbi:MAG: hypothetical protein IRZ14_01740 [Chloroflexi bacterium]|nr:hypothetical protein [Chloroflexota bacterium]